MTLLGFVMLKDEIRAYVTAKRRSILSEEKNKRDNKIKDLVLSSINFIDYEYEYRLWIVKNMKSHPRIYNLDVFPRSRYIYIP